MNGYLLAVARDALTDADDVVLATLRACTRASRGGVLVVVDSLVSASGARAPQPADAARPGLLVVGAPPPYDGRPLQSLVLRLPTGPDALSALAEWLRREDAELVDLPLELSGLLLHVVTARPRSAALPAPLGRAGLP